MIPENIIELAIKGGYWPKIRSEVTNYELELVTARETGKWQELIQKYVHVNMVLDPLFWQALGRKNKWKNWKCTKCKFQFDKQGLIACPSCSRIGHREAWRQVSLEFFDLLMTNGDTDKFWNNLK
jgi:hypothetical protein